MDLRVFVEPHQGASYSDQLAVARAAEDLGFDGFFRSDHFLAMGHYPAMARDPATGTVGLPGPTDTWLTLAALARETSRIRLGALVSSATFRLPGLLAIQAAQVDEMSGGRLEMGLGAGWMEAEHRAYGFPFPPRRFDLLTEQLEIVTGLWGTPLGERFSYHGEHYTLVDSPALPKPVQDPVPLIVGGHGRRRTPALAARFAGEYNTAFPPKHEIADRFAHVRAACEAADRDPDTLVYSVALTLAAGRSEQEVARRARAIGVDPAVVRETHLAGTVAEVVDELGRLAGLGASRVYLQVLDLHDLDHLELVAREVVPQL
jgi:F420-dependent oxidoreductase-like protein